MNGLAFVITGVLDSLERDEAADLIREHGGKVTTSLSKKTSYMVVGLEAGLKKLATADDLKIRQISEDELLDLIRTKSGLDKEADTKSNTNDLKHKKETQNESTIKSPKKEPRLTPKKEAKSSAQSIPKKEATTPRKSPRKQSIKVEKPSTPPKISNKKPELPHKSIKSEPKEGLWKSQDIVTDRKVTTHEQNIASIENQAWVEKYKPSSVKQIIGQQGAGSNVAK